MSRLIDLTGQKFERLIVVKRADNDKRGNSEWLCRCDCGKEKIINGGHLKNGNTKSCGCLITKHGHYKNGKMSKTYHSWDGMIQRCINPKHKNYHNYGDRGITVCRRWLKFENFLEDMGERPNKGYQIDRINNDGNYCKSNCRWVTSKTNNRNKRNNRLITYKGKMQCMAAWAEETDINYNTLCGRFLRGWSLEKALTTLVRKHKLYKKKVL